MSLKEFRSRDTLRKLWWLHDSFWHGALIKEMGHEKANRFNLEVLEKIFYVMTIMLLRERIIQRPNTVKDLMQIFKAIWKNAFYDDLYINDPIEYEGNSALWVGTQCHAFDSLKKADM